MTQDQTNNIQHGLGQYATARRFVARRGKEPINPITGYGAKANDQTTWGNLDQALAAVEKYGLDGIGVELGGNLCGIDEQGKISEQAQDIIDMMDSYTEISPSGTGIHILFAGIIPKGNRRKKDIEMYSEGRYFTVTGNLYGINIIEFRTEQAALVHKKYLSPEKRHDVMRQVDPPLNALAASDDELLKKMFASKNGTAIAALWNGDTSAYGGDESRADSALCSHLAFWAHNDTERINRLFRMSALYRDKWEREDYCTRTIERAIEAQQHFAVSRDFSPVVGDYVVSIEQPQSKLTGIDPLTDEKRYTWDDMGNGYLFADTYRNKYCYVPEAGSWYYFNSKVWVVDMGSIIGAEFAKQLVNR